MTEYPSGENIQEEQAAVAANRPVSLGRLLRNIREDAGLTQAEAAEKSGLSVIFLSVIENNRQRPSRKSLKKLAAAYQMNEVDFEELETLAGYRAAVGRRAAQALPQVLPSADAVADARHCRNEVHGNGGKGDGGGYPSAQDRMTETQNLSESLLNWALTAIDQDREYPSNPNWQDWPYLAKAMAVRLYQVISGRQLLTNEETARLHLLAHGGTIAEVTPKSRIQSTENADVAHQPSRPNEK